MNRLIIVGNGFDLAHNMKTSYYDFIFNYLTKSFITAQQQGIFDDALIEIKKNKSVNSNPSIEESSNLKSLLAYLKFQEKKGVEYIFLGNDSSNYYSSNELGNAYTLKIKSEFLNHLLIRCHDYRWVDIENEYYGKLKEILNSKESEEKTTKPLQDLNESLRLVIKLLNDYLAEQKAVGVLQDYYTLISEPIKAEDLIKPSNDSDSPPDSTLFLNFNYTNTIENYRTRKPNGQQIIYIHGKVNDKDNPIIFGFGDEHDETYVKIEAETRKGYLEYIKSFAYFKTSNYHNLIRFIESDDFQVFILGHSCGLSDRTMLKMIFEHDLCKSIKIFYHQTFKGNNHNELTQEISRHFKDKVEMRKKIVSLDRSLPMPQV